jgi:hypothetical protein
MPNLRNVHIIKDRFLFDDYGSGFYYDLVPIIRNPGTENDMNDRIDAANHALKETNPSQQNFKCTAFLTEAQYLAMNSKYYVQLGAKSYLMLFKSAFDGKAIPQNPWFDQGSGGIVFDAKTGIYYTNWTSEGIGFRYRKVNKSEVDAYQLPVITSPTGGGGGAGDTPTVGGIVHFVCPHCSKLII